MKENPRNAPIATQTRVPPEEVVEETAEGDEPEDAPIATQTRVP